uniref:Pyrin domain-containing protein n=1 Tax=Cricetulus griseus TaxID=10029 RepID=A0A8C2MCE8_CRIGR
MEEISGYDLALCLQKLSQADFMTFKVLLRKAPEEFELNPIPWTEIKMASRKGLVMLLNKNYPGKVWDIALSLFQKVKRKDLFAMTEALRRDKGTPYKETMKTLFNFIWNFESGIYVPYHEFEIITEMQYSSLQVVFEPQSQPVTAVILGNKGEGKTTFLRRAMLDWASGDLWQNRFHNAIKHWRMLCRVFQNLEVLDLDSCNFNETAISLLYLSMYPSHRGALNAFKLQSFSCSFVTNFGHGVLFHTLLQLPHLKSLNLYGTNLSNDVVENMCCVLKCSTCRVEELLLGKCNLSSEACGIIATSLIFCKVKHLSLVENPLKNKGVMLLCETLKRPSCDLETLMLSYCALTFIACGHLYEALLHNKYLSLLDLSSNFLGDTGVNILCKALKDPMCPLQELWLSGCYLTSDCCEEISAVLTHNQKLKTLKLGNNNIQDTGVRQLCEALSNPECKLQLAPLRWVTFL